MASSSGEPGPGLQAGRGAAPDPRGGVGGAQKGGAGYDKAMFSKRFDGREDPKPSSSSQVRFTFLPCPPTPYLFVDGSKKYRVPVFLFAIRISVSHRVSLLFFASSLSSHPFPLSRSLLPRFYRIYRIHRRFRFQLLLLPMKHRQWQQCSQRRIRNGNKLKNRWPSESLLLCIVSMYQADALSWSSDSATPIYRAPLNGQSRPQHRPSEGQREGGGGGGGGNNNGQQRKNQDYTHKPPPPGYICYRCGQKGKSSRSLSAFFDN